MGRVASCGTLVVQSNIPANVFEVKLRRYYSADCLVYFDMFGVMLLEKNEASFTLAVGGCFR